jgi:drug/metabolite transporter (DMT)-like permease
MLMLLWIPSTLAAAIAQTARNAMQRGLTDTLGLIGATQVRFLYGFPFALLFLAIAAGLSGRLPPPPNPGFLGFAVLGAIAQIAGTVLLLKAMKLRSFAVATACSKTEPVQVAIVAWVLLGDTLTPLKLGFIMLATLGVILVSFRRGETVSLNAAGPLLYGVSAGGLFALAAVAFRGGILSLDLDAHFALRASTMLAWGLGIQSSLLIIWLGLFDRPALTGSFKAWRPSLLAGFLGALASQFWFIAFSLTTAANVRTLALIEVPLAHLVSQRHFAEGTSRREIIGMMLIVAGVAGVLWLAL